MNIYTLTAFQDELARIKEAGVMDDAAKEESRMLSQHPHLMRHATPEAQLGHSLAKSPTLATKAPAKLMAPVGARAALKAPAASSAVGSVAKAVAKPLRAISRHIP